MRWLTTRLENVLTNTHNNIQDIIYIHIYTYIRYSLTFSFEGIQGLQKNEAVKAIKMS